MTRSKLQTIADGMRAGINKRGGGWTAATLPHGLELVLSLQSDDLWRLAMRRERVFPSDTEVKILADVFGVPDGIETARRRSWTDLNTKSKQPITWFVIELTWREIATPVAV